MIEVSHKVYEEVGYRPAGRGRCRGVLSVCLLMLLSTGVPVAAQEGFLVPYKQGESEKTVHIFNIYDCTDTPSAYGGLELLRDLAQLSLDDSRQMWRENETLTVPFLLEDELPADVRLGVAAKEGASGLAKLSLEDKRYLAYLYARSGDERGARRIANLVFTESPYDKMVLLGLAALYLERRDVDALDRVTRSLEKSHPTDIETRYYRSACEQLVRRPRTASLILAQIEAEQLREGREFQYRIDLAAASREAGDWPTAIRHYRKLIEDRKLSGEDEANVRRVLDDLYRAKSPVLELEGSARVLATGSIWGSKARVLAPASAAVRTGGEVSTRIVRHDSALGIKGGTHVLSEGAWLGWWDLSKEWQASWRLGGHEDGPLAEAGMLWRIRPGWEWTIKAGSGIVAEDGIFVEALNGRQHYSQSRRLHKTC